MFSKPIIMPHVFPTMLNPEFWLDKWEAAPTAKESRRLCETGVKNEVFQDIGRDASHLMAEYRQLLESQRNETFYNASGEEINDWPERLGFVGRILGQGLDIGYGLVVSDTSLKFLPSPAPFFNDNSRSGDLDRNQLSGLDPGDKVVILKNTPQNGYFPVISERGLGWAPSRDIALGSNELTESFHLCRHRRTIIDSKAVVLGLGEMNSVSMGCSFPGYPNREDGILFPKRQPGGRLSFGRGRIAGVSVTEPLRPSVENCIRQAFKYLGCHYAWGDQDTEGRGRDCSRLVQDVMAAMGIRSPRNSRDQYEAGIRRVDLQGCSTEERSRIIRSVSPGNLLFTNSHVMIYLGAIEHLFYVIHACYQYQDTNSQGHALGEEMDQKIKQVVVSDLSLGTGTSGGSLLDRLTGVVEIF